MTWIKICGITNQADAMLASGAGADALGFVFADSPRKVSPELAKKIIQSLPPFLSSVGVFVNERIENVREVCDHCGLDFVQLHGDEDQGYISSLFLPVIKAFRVRDRQILSEMLKFRVSYFLLDTYDPVRPGGTGRSFDWDIAERANGLGKLILSGGLNPSNVKEALGAVRPCGVDVSSGVEMKPGVKDPAKVERFIDEVREWDSQAD
jgi:phosphoribosylanthranilate isomerase